MQKMRTNLCRWWPEKVANPASYAPTKKNRSTTVPSVTVNGSFLEPYCRQGW